MDKAHKMPQREPQERLQGTTATEKLRWLAKLIFVLFCAETIFSLPYRSVLLSGRSVLLSSIAALSVLAVAGILFAFRHSLLPLLNRLLRFPSIGDKAWLIFWLFFGLALRLAWALRFPVSLKSDHLAYFQLATDMAQGHTGPGAYWPPGFSLFLAPFFMVLGNHRWVYELCALLLFIATYLLTFAIARRIQGGLAARIAPMLVAIWPGYLTLSGINCKEVFLGVLVPATILFYLKASDDCFTNGSGLDSNLGPSSNPNGSRFRWWYVIVSGLCMGLATLTQPGYMLFPAVVFGFEIVRGTSLLRSMGRTILFSLALIAAVLPWTYRNYLVFHRVVLVSTNGGSVFYRANNPLANGNYAAEGEVALPKDEFEADRLGYKMADEWIEHHPGDFAALMVKKQAVFLGDDALGAYETLKRDLIPSVALYSSIKGVSNLFWLASWTVLLLGFPLLFRLENWRLWFGLLLLPLLYQWAIDSVFESGPRHHVPYVALIAVLVGIALSTAIQPESNSR
jgi:4-amino-4-deoxy-L-arabinose transferase-like glycosyltransferase